MIAILFTTLFSAGIGILFKYSEKTGLNRYRVTSVNYLVAMVAGLTLVVKDDLYHLIDIGTLPTFLSELPDLFLQTGSSFPHDYTIFWSVLVGIMTGLFFLNAFIVFQKSINENGIALSAISSRLGILLPMTLSIILWKELPHGIQYVGIGLAILAIIIINFNPGEIKSEKIRYSLALLFILTGCGMFGAKLFQVYADTDYKPLFLFTAFLTAFIFSLGFLKNSPGKFNRKEIAVGAAVGICNISTNLFLILALSQIKASLVFPITGSSTIVLMVLGGVMIFGERLKTKDVVAIIMTVLAVVLIDL